MNLLNKKDCLVLIIDIQEKLVKAVKDKSIVENAVKLVQAANVFEIPVIATEQYPKSLGSTDESLEENFSDDTKIFEKTAFSVLKEDGFYDCLKSYNKKQIIICGIEAHICVHQTAADLVKKGFDVYFVKDASGSRNEFEFMTGIERMMTNGVKITSLETTLFELLETSKNPVFKEIQQLIK